MARKDDIKDTGFPGIKQRVSDGKYIVTLDLGRQRRVDKKTGEVRTRQIKSTRVVSTLKEAKAIQGKNNQVKRHKKVSGIAGKIRFDTAIQDFMDFHEDDWGVSHKARQHYYAKRLNAYFGDMDVREIDTMDVEMFFQWCRQKNAGFEAIGNNTIKKIKSMMSQLYKYMYKSPNRYDVHTNPVPAADVGKLEPFEAVALSIELVNEIMEYMLHNETDTSIYVLWGLACLCGMRRGEICGLQWGDIDWKSNRIYISRQRAEVGRDVSSNGWIVKVPKNGDDNGKTPSERRERWAALPTKMAQLLKLAKRQQSAYGGKRVLNSDYVFRSKVNLVNGYLSNPGKLDRRWQEFQTRCNKVRKLAGKQEIPKYRIHDLRHTFISLCLNDGVNPLQVSASVGHSFNSNNANTTVATYWHDNGDRSQIVACIDKLVSVDIKVFDAKEELYTPKERTSNRINLRSDEI